MSYDNPRPSSQPVGSVDLAVAKDDLITLDLVVAGNAGDVVTNRKGKQLDTLAGAIDKLSWNFVGLFSDGVTFTKSTDYAITAEGDQWIYTGSYPFSAPAGTVPSAPLYQTINARSHANLNDRNPADGTAHNADDIDNQNGGTLKETSDKVNEIAVSDVLDFNFTNPYRVASDYAPNWIGVIHTGQSLAAGGVGADDIGTVYDPLNASRAFMLSGQPVHQRNGTWSKKLKALSERNFGEESIRVTIASSFLNWIIKKEVEQNLGNKWVFNGHAWGAQNYQALKKGGSTGVYEKLIAQATDTLALQSSIEYPYFTCIHGETDGLENNQNYESNLVEWRNDFDTDIKALTGQATDVHMLLCQTATAGGYDSNGGITDTDFIIPQSQLNAHKNNPLITMVCSKYHLPYNDRSHITNLGQRTLGEYYGKMIDKIRQGATAEPVRPIAITRPTSSSVEIEFAGVIGGLSFDTALVQSITNRGFDYVDDSGNTITSVTITDTNKVTIQLSGSIGANPFVSYAYHNGAGGEANQIAGLGDRGNLRDNDPARSRFDSSIRLYNWAVIFKEAVPA